MAAITVLIALLAAACGGGGKPEDLVIPVKLEGGKLLTVKDGVLSSENFEVKQDDRVTLKIEAEVPVEFHLHGYDITQDVMPGEVVDFFFEANIAGRFKITAHLLEEHVEEEGEHGEGNGDEHSEEEVEIAVLLVNPR